MEIKPLISVILPVYNGGVCLKASIQSILKQDFQEFEFIVVNDGSSDNTKEIINSFDNSKIRYFENKVNQVIVRSLNWGLHLSSGKFIARMDIGRKSADVLLEYNFGNDSISYINNYEQKLNALAYTCVYFPGFFNG